MGKVHSLRLQLEAYVKNLPATINRIVNVDVAEDLELLEKQQLRASKMPDGSDIKPDYAPPYAAYKSRFFSSSFGDGKVNFLLHGNLYKNIDIKAAGGKYRYFTTVPYAPKLATKYGDFLAGLAPFKQPTAKSITTRAIAKDLKSKVFK